MSSTTPLLDRHPVEAVVTGIGDRLKDVRDVPVYALDTATTKALLVEMARVKAQLAELETRILAHGQTLQVEHDTAAASTATWWAHQTRQTKSAAHRTARLAAALATERREPVRVALADGDLLPDQAEAIIAAIDALPEDLDPDIVEAAQAHLIRLAAEFDAKHLRVLGRRILEVVAPEIGEAHEAELLARQEREADQAASLRMSDDGHGKTYGRFTLPTWVADQLRKHLTAIAAPKHRTAVDGHAPDYTRPTPHRLGQAFAEYVQRYRAHRLPDTGGINATAVVLIPLETMLGGLKAAHLDTGTPISPGLARRLLCEAGIIPAVLGGKSEVLDLGRKRRLHSKAQRIALLIEQQGCTAEGCDRPAWQCHAHHDHPWAHGGPTSVTNGRLLCPFHHHRAHDTTYDMRRLPDGQVRFHRRN